MNKIEAKRFAEFMAKKAQIIDMLMKLAEVERQGENEGVVNNIIKTVGLVDLSKSPDDLKLALKLYGIVVKA
jgi:hypothetical protein